jgi:hypothetical protein
MLIKKEKNRRFRRSLGRFMFVFTLIFFLLPIYAPQIPVAKAYSAEITYAGAGTSQNNGTYARFDNNYAFIVGNHIGVYSSSGVLIRDIDLSGISTAQTDSFIYPLNSTHALVVINLYYYTYYSLLVKITTGTYSTVGYWGAGYGYNSLSLSPIFKYGSNYYTIFAYYDYTHGTVAQGVEKIFPTVASVSITPTGNYIIRTPCFFIQSQTDSSIFYIIARQGATFVDDFMNTKRFRVDKLDFTASTIIGLGDGALDYDWSSYVVCMGSERQVYHGSSAVYNVLVSYPDLASAGKIWTTLIRFNDTSLSEYSYGHTDTAYSSCNFLRPFTFNNSQLTYTNLEDGTYEIDYWGTMTIGWRIYTQIMGYNTDLLIPPFTDTTLYKPTITGGPYYGYYNPYSSVQIGGLNPPEWPICVYIDYTNHKFEAGPMIQKWFESASYTFSYVIKEHVSQAVVSPPYFITVDKMYDYYFTWTYGGNYTVQGQCTISTPNITINNPTKSFVNSRATYTFSFPSVYAGWTVQLKAHCLDYANAYSADYYITLYLNHAITTTTTHTSITSTGGPGVQISQGVNWLLLILVLAPAIALAIIGAKLSADAAVFLGLLGFGVSLGLNYNIHVYDPITNADLGHPIPDFIVIFLFVALSFAITYGIFNRVRGRGETSK